MENLNKRFVNINSQRPEYKYCQKLEISEFDRHSTHTLGRIEVYHHIVIVSPLLLHSSKNFKNVKSDNMSNDSQRLEITEICQFDRQPRYSCVGIAAVLHKCEVLQNNLCKNVSNVESLR